MISTLAPPKQSRRLLTVSDVSVLPQTLPTGDVKYELDDGELQVMAPPGNFHGAVQSNVAAILKVLGEYPGHGRARSEIGLVLRRNPDRLVCPDVVFISKDSDPILCSPEGYLETIPELVVEVKSPNDSWPELRSKVGEYLAAGVRIVWVLDPAKQVVHEHRATGQSTDFGPGDTVTLPGLIPGFTASVASLFRL